MIEKVDFVEGCTVKPSLVVVGALEMERERMLHICLKIVKDVQSMT